jgi:hypothetical protein
VLLFGDADLSLEAYTGNERRGLLAELLGAEVVIDTAS